MRDYEWCGSLGLLLNENPFKSILISDPKRVIERYLYENILKRFGIIRFLNKIYMKFSKISSDSR